MGQQREAMDLIFEGCWSMTFVVNVHCTSSFISCEGEQKTRTWLQKQRICEVSSMIFFIGVASLSNALRCRANRLIRRLMQTKNKTSCDWFRIVSRELPWTLSIAPNCRLGTNVGNKCICFSSIRSMQLTKRIAQSRWGKKCANIWHPFSLKSLHFHLICSCYSW